MKAILTISMFMLACASAFGQVTGLKAERNNKEEKELLRLEQEVGEAYKNRDKAFYRRQFADDFIGTDALGNIYNKTQFLADLDKVQVESYSFSDLAVKLYGDTAIVTGLWTDKSTFNGLDSSGTYRFMDIGVKRNGRWVVIASQATRVPTAPTTLALGATTEQELKQVRQAYDQAWLQQDAAAFERLLADDAVLTDQNGKVSTKAEVIADAKSGTVKFEVGQSADVKVRFYGDTAVVSSRWTEKSTHNGKQVNSTMQNTIVYVKRNGNWQVVSDQVTSIIPPKP